MAKNTVSFLVENQPGVLFNVSNLFRRRGFNIDSITVGAVENPKLARMTIQVDADERTLNKLIGQLDKMVEVIKVKRLDPMRTLEREMLMVKLSTSDPMAREDAVKKINEYHGLILDIEPDTIIAEVTGEPDALEDFLSSVRSIGIVEMSRTGVTAIERGRLQL